MAATIGILNVGAGDTKISFDPTNPAECIRAARIVKDMLRRGYALLIDSGKKDKEDRPIHVRALDFDERTYEYIIADLDPLAAERADQIHIGGADAKIETLPRNPKKPASSPEPAESTSPAPLVKPKRGRPTKRIAAAAASGVAVSRTAGG